MCFGSSQPQATVTTPAVSVDQISAGKPTVTAAADKTSKDSTTTPTPLKPQMPSQTPGPAGLKPWGM